MLKPYPDAWTGRAWRFLLDVVFLAWAAACAFVGWTVYHLVAGLVVVARALIGTGQTLDRWVDAFRRSVPHGIPGLSDALLRIAANLQRNGGDALIQQGTQAEATIERLAVALALIAALPLFLTVAVVYLPWRYREARERGAAAAFLRAAQRGGRLEQAKALLAYRAVASLPFRRLMKVSDDPVGDLDAGRYDALARAMARRAGVRFPRTSARTRTGRVVGT
jgi:hypothetical protein